METQLPLSALCDRTFSFISKKSEDKYWLVKLSLFCAVLSWCLAVPPYTVSAGSDAWAFVKIQAFDLLHPTNFEVYIRRENMVMRWMLPLMYRLTGGSVVLILVVQALLGVAFLYIFSREVFRQAQDKVITVLVAVAVSNIFVFSWFLVDTAGYGDAYAYFFLLLALFVRNPILLFICLQAAFFTDERAIVASGYVALWWITRNLIIEQGDRTLLSLIRSIVIPSTWVVMAALVSYLVFRRYIMTTYFPAHIYTTLGTPVLLSDAGRWGLGSSLWASFEGTWLLLGCALLALYINRYYWLLALLILGFLTLLTTGIFVDDIDRALGYGFPFLLMSSLILSKTVPRTDYRKLALVVALICVIHPLLYTMGANKVIWAEPLPMKAMMALDRLAGWGVFD